MRRGRKSLSQTPSPLKERIKGSKVNPKGSASSKSSASSIKLSDSIITTLEKKKDEYNKKHSKKVSLATLKAVFRRGSGAYSSSHRPTITGGVPNTRSAWAFARVNKFLLKKGGTKVKAAYVQDDDLMAKGGLILDEAYSGKDVKKYLEKANYQDDSFFQYIKNSDKYVLKNVNINSIVQRDSGLHTHINQSIDEVSPNENEWEWANKFPIVIGDNQYDKNIVLDGYHRITQAIVNGEDEILAFVKREKYEDGGLIAPNGKKSNLTPEQYKLVRTPQFKAWFGDWENDPQNASKVVDENGEPLVVYHGTNYEINKFMPYSIDYYYEYGEPKTELIFRGDESIDEFKNKSKEKGWRFVEPNFWFSKNNAYKNSKIQYKCFLKIIHLKKQIDDIVIKRTEKDLLLKNFGVEVIFSNDTEKYYCVFESNQIKLADGSNTTFDANNPNIRYEDGGLLKSLSMGMDNLKKNGIVLKDENTIVIAYNSGNQKIEPSLYNKALIYKSIKPIKSASNIIEKLDLQQYERFDEDKINEYKKGHLIILNQNEVIYDSENPNMKYEDGGLIAPNGKKSNLTPEQYKLVRTPQFKAWFGDWENDSLNASKVVDENGEPLVVYRGMPKKRKVGNIFKYNVNLFGTKGIGGRQTNKFAFYFTDMKKVAQGYVEDISEEEGGYVVKSYFLNVRKLFKAFSKKNQYETTFKELYDLANTTGNPVYFKNYRGEIETDYQGNKLEVWNHTYEWERKYSNKFPNRDEAFTFFVDWNKEQGNQYFWRLYLEDYLKYDGLVFYETTNNATRDNLGEDLKPMYGDEFSKTYAVFEPNQIKLADGSNTTFDPNNPDIRYKGGGEMGDEITCHNCNWHWNTDDSKKFDKYVCHKCGFDNKIYYMHKRGGNLPVGKLARGMSVSEVAAVHGLEAKDIKKELILGVETEMEHTDKSEYARAIALDHLYEDPRYYTKLKKMEGLDKHYQDISKKYANGGTTQEVFHFNTPTGEKSSLSYLQQVLVRTKAFKNWFGDWEMASKIFLQDGKENFEKHYKDVSKVLDYNTLEPRVVYHGTRVENEFFVFDATREAGQGRPYGYFAHNIEYSQNFTTSSQRGHSAAKPFLYQCFVNIRNPFMAIGQQYEGKSRNAEDWLYIITASIMWDKYGKIEKNSQTEGLALAVISQIGKYLENTWGGIQEPFWVSMARDINKEFKFFLLSYNYDGIFYGEQFSDPYDIDDPAQYTRAVCIFDSNQVKLADGRNIDFDPMNVDIRFKEGGKLMEQEEESPNDKNMNKREHLRSILVGEKYAEGGKVVGKQLSDTNDGKKGGYFKGRSHAEGGIKAYNVDTGKHIEVEGEEVIITKGAVSDTQKREFEGEMLTNREILSRINQSGGGVAFEEGGEIKGHECGCSGKKYKYGGELMEDFNIMRKMNEPFNLAQNNLKQARSFVDDLISKMR